MNATNRTSPTSGASLTHQRWQAFQSEINAISTHLVALPWQDVDAGIHHTLERLGAFVQAHRAYIFRMRDDGLMDNTHEWCAPGIVPQIDNLKDQRMDEFPWWMERLRLGETIHVPSVADLPEAARAEKVLLQTQNIASIIVVPLVRGTATIGFLGFDAVKTPRVWPDFVPILLRVTADILATVLDRQRSDRLLHESHERLERLVDARTRLAKEETARALRANDRLRQTVESLTQTNQALAQTQAALRVSEAYAQLLVINSTLAMAVHEMIFDADGTPTDYRFLSANSAFERMTGLRIADIEGRCVSEVFPDISETPFIRLYGEVVKTGKPLATETYSAPLRRHYNIHAYALSERRFATVFQDITGRKHMEQEIEESHRRLETILNAFPDLMFIFNREGVVVDYHASNPTLLYAPPNTFIGSTLDSALPGDVAAASRRCIEKAFTSGEPQSHTYSLAEPDGIQHYEARICSMDAQRVLGIVRNITDRVRALADLESSEERYRLAVKASRDVIWEHDCNQNRKTWSEGGNAQFGWQADAAHPRPAEWWMDRVHPEDRPQIERLLSEALDNPGIKNIEAEYRFQRENGEYAHVHDRTHIERDADGRAHRLIGAMLDVTARKETEIAHARLQLQLNHSQQIAHLGSWEYHHAENRLLWSDETYRLFGMDPHRFSESYEGFLSTVHPDDFERVKTEFARSLADPGHSYALDHRLIRRDTGEVRIVHEKCTHERDADGKPVRSFGFVQDITDATRREAHLRQSQKLETIGRLTAGVAHEINNPVGFLMNNLAALETAVTQFRGLLVDYRALRRKAGQVPDLADEAARLGTRERETKMDFLLDDLDALFAESREGLDRITRIVSGMRSFSRDDRNDRAETWDVNESVRSTLSVARNEHKYHCHIVTALDPKLPSIHCVPGKISQVLLNLVVNAAQAIQSQKRTDKGTVRIRTFSRDSNVVIDVRDDGPGIPVAVRNKLFEPFVTTKPHGKGTGLGLSISRDIVVSQHGGDLTVESREGQGSTFRVTLPVAGRSDSVEASS